MIENGPVLIAGVGHPFLRDISVGPVLVPELKEMDWPDGTEIHDLHFGPIHVVQWLQEKPGHFNRVVLLSAVKRGRAPGAVFTYRWDGALPDAEEIQQRVGEAVTGIIDVDNLLIIGGYFGIWPDEVAVVEVEPCEEAFGEEFSEPVQAALPSVMRSVREVALGSLEGLTSDPFGLQSQAALRET